MNFKSQMERLDNYIGKKVSVEHVRYGIKKTETGKLEEVDKYGYVDLGPVSIPFIGSCSAIQQIMGENDEVLYENPAIPEDYNPKKLEEVNKFRRECFGIEEEIKPVPEPKRIEDSELEEMLVNGRLTKNQFGWVMKQDQSHMGRGYALICTDAANELYKFAEKIQDRKELIKLGSDVIELSKDNAEVLKDEFSAEANQIIECFNNQGLSNFSYQITLRKFIELLEEKAARVV